VSRAKDAITKQAESQGWTVTRIEWEPVGLGAEKEGPSGGWDVDLARDDREEWAGGYNVAQVVQWIRNLDKLDGPWMDPFACSGKVHSLQPGDCALARGHRGSHWPIGPDGRMVESLS
jgi:hypothetical protein